ncbi:MAG: CoA ester lyase [Burkholderiaceae bacterium]|nr:CoA ester lyase [Burkholderiaceae bacterium]
MSGASLLFVPASRPERYLKAQQSGAGGLILDLEDSVAPAAKDQARRHVVQMLAAQPAQLPVWVRVNPATSGLLLSDLAAVVPGRPFGIVLPKCAGQASLAPLCHQLDALEVAFGVPRGHTRILAIATETAASIFRLGELAGVSERLWGIAWGGEDLAADIGALANRVDGRFTEPYRLARSLCLYAAASAGVRAVDTVSVAIDAPQQVQHEAEEARRDGFVAKMAIHPSQIAPIERAFAPSAEQLRWAQRVVAAFAAQPDAGALQLDGQMLDLPHLRLARRLLGQ